MSEEPLYLGDGVYATFDGYRIKLTANVLTTDTIYLEPQVMSALKRFADRCYSPEGLAGAGDN